MITTTRTIEKRRTITESAAPCANEIASWAYPEMSPAPIDWVRSSSCFSIRIPSRPWSSSHFWSRSMSTSTPVWPVAALSSVRYASTRSAAERVSETTTVPSATSRATKSVANSDRHDGDGEATWEPQARQVADERVEGERDHGGGEEQEQDVPERPREEEREQEDDRKADELDPPRDPDRRGARARVRRAAEAILILGRASGHSADRSPAGSEVRPTG